jgi:hypothetical protein
MQKISVQTDSGLRGPTIAEWNALSKFTCLKILDFSVDGSVDIESVRMLPQSIEELSLHRFYGPESQEMWDEILKALPQNLKKLEDFWPHYWTVSFAKNLPRTLESMPDKHCAPEFVEFLPPNLTELSVPDPQNPEDISSFPPKLCSLELPFVTETLIEMLPTQLKTLILDDWPSGEIVAELPRSITSLSFYGDPESPPYEIEPLFAALPPSLISFTASPVNDDNEESFISTSSNSSLLLPRCLEELHIGCLDFSESNMTAWALGLPTQLSTLSIIVTDLQQGFCISLSTLTALRDLELTVYNPPTGGWAQCLDFRSLPRSLTFLSFLQQRDESKASDINNDTFIGAPMGLIRLTIPHSPLLSKDCLIHFKELDKIMCYSRSRRLLPIDW